MDDIAFGPGVKIIHTYDITSFCQKAFTKKRAQKSGSSGNQHTFSKMHIFSFNYDGFKGSHQMASSALSLV
jgi:hypothetical protein